MFTRFKVEAIVGLILLSFILFSVFLIRSVHQENTVLKTETIAQQLKLGENEAGFNTLIKTDEIANKVTKETVKKITSTQRTTAARIENLHRKVSQIKSKFPKTNIAQLKTIPPPGIDSISQVRIEAIYTAYCSADAENHCEPTDYNPAS